MVLREREVLPRRGRATASSGSTWDVRQSPLMFKFKLKMNVVKFVL